MLINKLIQSLVLKDEHSADDLLLLQEFLPIVKSLIKTREIVLWVLNTPDFVFMFLLCAFLKQVDVTNEVFEDLGIMCQTPEGHEQVLMAFDTLMLYAQEKIRFQTTVALLNTASDVEVVTTIRVFFNVLLSTTPNIAQRLAV